MRYNNLSFKHRSQLSTPVRLGVVAVAACFISAPAFSNPVNPTVVNGAATFHQSGNVLTVTNSNGAVINWDKFSIQTGETTHFAQTAASSTVLNRVLNDPTAIYGTLSSNGRVWLVNPAGIMVGPGGRVDTAGFVASTLAIRNEDFLAGRNLFINGGGAGDVINQGEIKTPAGGSVYLIGTNVSNEGIITTPQGETLLAAGATVSLIDSATPGVKVDITGAEGNATNLGNITAEAGRIGIAGVIVRNSGTLNASSVVSDGGRIFLKASQDAYVDGNGRIVTTGTKGGSIEVLGKRVAVTDRAVIDASASEEGGDGGRILVGGDYQGKNPDVPNAQITYFGPDAELKADAGKVGAGGTAIVWADDTTRAHGSISARGGAEGGDGGFVETSGHRALSISGARVDTRAPAGKTGSWLLDPTDISIVSGVYGGVVGGGIFDPASNSVITDTDINAALAQSSLTIQTSGGTGGTGNITVTGASISSGLGNDLSLLAYGGVAGATGNIDITGSSIFLGGGILRLVAGWDGTASPSFGNVVADTGNITVSNSLIDANNVKLISGGDIYIGSASATVATGIHSNTVMDIFGRNITLRGGDGDTSGTQGPGVLLQSEGAQALTATGTTGQILLQAGSGNNSAYGGSISFGASVSARSNSSQNISANVIKLYAGATGHDNNAEFQSYGSQSINITGTGGLLELKGGGDASTGVLGGAGSFNNQARIQHGTWTGPGTYSGTGGQYVTVDGGGSIVVQAGSGTGVLGNYSDDCATATGDPNLCRTSSNSANIDNGIGGQVVSFTTYGSLAITGGSAGTGNSAGVNNKDVDQQILGDPNITLTGGSGGGSALTYGGEIFEFSNEAGIDNQGSASQTIHAGTIVINAGNATYGGAGMGSDSGNGLYVTTTGNLSMYGGSSNATHPHASAAYFGNKYGGVIDLDIGGDMYVHAGSGTSSPVIIGTLEGAADVNIHTDGNLYVRAGSGTSSSAVTIGALNDAATVSIDTGGNMTLVADGGHVAIGSSSSSYGASVTLDAGGNLTMTDSATRGVRIGSLYDTVSATNVLVKASNNLTVGTSTGYGALIGVQNPTNPSSGATVIAGYRSGGGNLLLAASSRVKTGGTTDLEARQDGPTANGNITQDAGSIVQGGNLYFFADGSANISGSMTASTGFGYGYVGVDSPYGGSMNFGATSSIVAQTDLTLNSGQDISIASGASMTSYGDMTLVAGGEDGRSTQWGGNITSAGQIVADGNVDIHAYVGYGTYNNGNITQTGGSIDGDNVSILAGGSVNLAGTVDTDVNYYGGQLTVRAGYQSTDFDDGVSGITPYGGNIDVTGSLFGYNSVDLKADAGSSFGLNGNIAQMAGSMIDGGEGYVDITGAGNIGLDGSVATIGSFSIVSGGDTELNGSVSAYGGSGTVRSGTVFTTGPTASGRGGNITLGSGSHLSSDWDMEIFAASGSTSYGDIVQSSGGTVQTDDYSDIIIVSAGNTNINGTVSAGYKASMGAGLDPFSPASSSPGGYGGSISFGSNSIVDSRQGNEGDAIKVVTSGGSRSQGDIVQAAGGQFIVGSGGVGYGHVRVLAYGDARMDGSTLINDAGSGYGVYVGAGMSNSSGLSSNFSGPVRAGSSNLASIGDLTVGYNVATAAGGLVKVKAAGSILQSTGNLGGPNITADIVNLESVYGGLSGDLAISSVIENASSITVNVDSGATYGGISIHDSGLSQPTTVALTDAAMYEPSIGFYYGGDLALGAGHVFNAGAGEIAVTSGGSMMGVESSRFAGVPASIQLVAQSGDMTMSSPLMFASADIGLAATGLLTLGSQVSGANLTLFGSTIDILAPVAASGDLNAGGGTLNVNGTVTAQNAVLAATTINIATGSVSAVNDAIVIGSAINIGSGSNTSKVSGANVFLGGGTLNLTGGVYADYDLEFYLANVIGGSGGVLQTYMPTGDITGIVSGNIALDGGAYFRAGHDVDLSLQGAASTLSLSNGSYLLADSPLTIKLTFTARSSGGVVIDSSPYSGFFVGNLSTRATPGHGLVLAYAQSVTVVDPCVINPASCSSTNQTPPPPPSTTGTDDPTKPTTKPGTTTGGEEGTFGSEDGGDEDEEDKKKSDEAKDEKKDDKPAKKKKLAQCT